MVRCFIGITIPNELKDGLESVKSELKKLPMNCKFVEKENFHICLSFLGELEKDKLEDISKELGSICKNFSKFEVIINGIKMIPNDKYVRVLALDIIDRNNALGRLMKDIQKRIGGSVNPPHLTLCRVRNISDKQSTIQKIKSIKTEEVGFPVSAVQIIKSELRKTGPVYTPVSEAVLK